jgi:hypothetical protein
MLLIKTRTQIPDAIIISGAKSFNSEILMMLWIILIQTRY